MRRAVESRNLVSFVVSAAVGPYLFRIWPLSVENDPLQMVLLQKPYLFCGIKYGFVAMLFFNTVHRILEPILIYIHFCYAARRANWAQAARTISSAR